MRKLLPRVLAGVIPGLFVGVAVDWPGRSIGLMFGCFYVELQWLRRH